jgi:lysophospholipase L1-like esterase
MRLYGGSVPSPALNNLSGKKIIAIGDSMVKGHSLSDAQTWLYKLATRNNMTYTNYGINGCCLSYNSIGAGYAETDSVINRYSSMDSTADYVIVFAGTNDANKLITIGSDSSTTNTEFKGALNLLCDGLITKYPAKKIGFITPYLRNSNYQSYVDAIESICAKYSIPVFNSIKNGGVCWTNTAQVSALTLGDTYHLNDTGMTYASTKYESFINSL